MVLPRELKEMIKERDGFKCAFCGCDNKLFLTIDHKTPKSQGGRDVASNLITCCGSCNSLKGDKNVKEFKKYIKGLESLKDLGHVKIHVNNVTIRYTN